MAKYRPMPTATLLANDPLVRFHAEFERARSVEPHDVTVVALATVSALGAPSVRYVLLKDADARGFVFYTNRESRKGEELAANAHAALAFLWPSIAVQVRVEGQVELVSDEESDAYFATRPRGSQIGAWASQQSRPLASRKTLEDAVGEYERRFGETGAVPRPAHWGGYRLVPSRVEFWQGRESRLHERDVYLPDGAGWRVESIYP